ncbi:hypothetical protein N0V90_005560 [Kalmusia sp. IMI 367209]|nr:hypothetical protein N0V90_005560 [Kalmusia sp. IMI 367209]
MATVCSEARSQAAKFFHDRVKLVDMWYAVDAPDKPSDTGEEILEPVVLWDDADAPDEPSDAEAKILKPIFMQPTTVLITTGDEMEEGYQGRFDSAEHLVNIVSRVFGSGIEQLILRFSFADHNAFNEMYWTHTERTHQDLKPIFIDDQSHPLNLVYMTPDRKAHVKRKICSYKNEDNLKQLAYHLQKFHDILDAAEQKLPRLQIIMLELDTYVWGKPFQTRIHSISQDGVLWVDWRDVKIGRNHYFSYGNSASYRESVSSGDSDDGGWGIWGVSSASAAQCSPPPAAEH